ncbi:MULTISPECIES: hypothetical protein [Providencia]|uniref:GP46 protein n=2 Tax=Providencia TaxID=586 RepID=A0ABT9ATD6_9GAMM|nr:MULTISPECIES: hypothetical protein [Providencia]ELR5138140.1 hypothetical protein [Providencia rettgeri]ELR5168967.1 hypothetical protein [Providencia rettgeri]MBQ0267170.1 hypothetical protein [Providencia huaxiensis]MDB9568306.1 hypothetical protein [Providencia rettgeri]MDO7829575.1 hypothetical protein [Providencia sp. CRE-138-0026]
MAKSPAERKAEQRKRQKESGVTKIELFLDEQEIEMLQRNCALRRPGREPYDIAEYLSMLIRIDDRSVISLIKELNKRRCKKCNEQLPVAECCLSGSSECWNTQGWHELKLAL